MAREHEVIYTEYAKIILHANIRHVLLGKSRNWNGQQNLEYKYGHLQLEAYLNQWKWPLIRSSDWCTSIWSWRCKLITVFLHFKLSGVNSYFYMDTVHCKFMCQGQISTKSESEDVPFCSVLTGLYYSWLPMFHCLVYPILYSLP